MLLVSLCLRDSLLAAGEVEVDGHLSNSRKVVHGESDLVI